METDESVRLTGGLMLVAPNDALCVYIQHEEYNIERGEPEEVGENQDRVVDSFRS